jgi:membrane-bound lytic murein transglycosylase D
MGLFRGLHIAPRVATLMLAATLVLLTGCVPENPVTPGPAKAPQATAPVLKPTAPTTAAAKPPATPAAKPQVQALIDSVEAAYQSGVTDYHAGKLQSAKADFDRAVDMMLTSNFDLRTEPQLHDEFDRILDAVNTLETEALKQGNGFAPKIEPAPVDIANDVTFPVDPTVKAQAIAELKTTVSDLPLVINDPVAGYISYFSSKGKGTLTRSLERAGRYHAMISAVLAEEKVPQDLIYQAVAESGFQPQAVNGRSGAGGMWQFMPSGPYGLARTGGYDERFDPEKSTHAYARYMKVLYAQLGDWYLAMAAYDWGPGNVQKAVQRTGYADFWELYHRNVLPQETKNYVPIIIAAAIMAKNPQQYGLQSLTPDPPLLVDTVTTDYSVDLRLVSDLVEAPVQEITDLNPSLLRMSTPSDAFELHLPAGSKDLYQKRISEIPADKRNQWRFHKVVAGESLQTVARDYHVTPAEIVFVNQLEAGDDLSSIDSLIIPVPPAPSSRSRLTLYKVEHGDTLVTVADRFNVTVQQLRRWNHLTSARVEPGRRLYVAEPARVTSSRRRASASTKPTASGKEGAAHSAASAHKPAAHTATGAHTTAKNSPPAL